VSFKAILNLEDDHKDIPVLECSYSFIQDVDATGKAITRVKGGTIKLTVEATADTNLIGWMLGHNSLKKGSISFFKRDNESALKKIEFTNALCVDYQEEFTSTGIMPMLITITISPDTIRIGTESHENLWDPKKI
jgi:hypothetical protein